MTKVFLISACLLLSSCASIKRQFCDCCAAKENKSTEASVVPPAPAVTSHPVKTEKPKVEKEEKPVAPIPVDNEDIELTNRMLKAVDAYVFKGDNSDFNKLCQDPRFDCFVNEKKIPEGRKRKKRKVPPFISGSKSGLQPNNERINVRYSFYP